MTNNIQCHVEYSVLASTVHYSKCTHCRLVTDRHVQKCPYHTKTLKGLNLGGKIARGISTEGGCSVGSFSPQEDIHRSSTKITNCYKNNIISVMCCERILHVSALVAQKSSFEFNDNFQGGSEHAY